MPLTSSKINLFLLFKLPSAYFCGVRTKSIDRERCITTVKHRWINQNPFKSMFWAVQGMAAELSTGALVIQAIEAQDKPVSMLVTNNNGQFLKKARGRIHFTCQDGLAIQSAMQKALETGEGQTCRMRSTGVDAAGDEVSRFEFEWSVRVKNQ